MLNELPGTARIETRHTPQNGGVIRTDVPQLDKAPRGRFISIANMKGGVGKTTTVVSLAETIAARDLSTAVLVVDIDPQASASLCLAGDDGLAELIEDGKTLQDFLEARIVHKKRNPISDYIFEECLFTTHAGKRLNISILPCGPELRLLERQIIYEFTKGGFGLNAIEGQLWKIFQADLVPLRTKFDFVIFDCPPGISPFSEVAIRGSDMVIVPTIPDRISIYGLNAFCSRGWQCGTSTLPEPPRPHVLITRMQENVRQHQIGIKSLEREAEESDSAFSLFKTRIPQSAPLASALVNDQVMPFTKKYSLPVAQLLDRLAGEVAGLADADRR